MSSTELAPGRPDRQALSVLFRDLSPVLVEVRFPRCATSPDWHLLEEEAELDALLERLAPGAELHLRSVWDLKSSGTKLCVTKPQTATEE